MGAKIIEIDVHGKFYDEKTHKNLNYTPKCRIFAPETIKL